MKRIRANQLAAHKYHFKQITSSMSFKFCNNASPPYMNDVFKLADQRNTITRALLLKSLRQSSLQFFTPVSTAMSAGPTTLSRTCFIDI